MEKIINEHKGFIRSIIKKLNRSYDEDLEQEIYIKAWQALEKEQYNEEGKISSWIGMVARNTCFDYFRSKAYRNSKKSVDGEEIFKTFVVEKDREEAIDTKTRQKEIINAINSLPKGMSKVVFLYEYEGYSYLEISKKLKISEGTVKSRMFNSRKILSEKLKHLKGE